MEASLGFTFVGEIQVHGTRGPRVFHNRWVVLGIGSWWWFFLLKKIGVGGAFWSKKTRCLLLFFTAQIRMAAPMSGIKHAESLLHSREGVQRKVPQGNNQINNYSMVDRGFLSWLISSTSIPEMWYVSHPCSQILTTVVFDVNDFAITFKSQKIKYTRTYYVCFKTDFMWYMVFDRGWYHPDIWGLQ